MLSVGWVLSLQENGEEFEHRLLDGESRVLQPLLTNLAKAFSDDGAECLLQECHRVLLLLKIVEVDGLIIGWDLDWKLGLRVS